RKTVSLPISPPARSIARFELDKELLDAARRAGVDVKEEITVRHVEPGATFNVQTVLSTVSKLSALSNEKQQTSTSFSARAVVNSTGRWSQLTQPTATDTHKWIGLKGHFRETAPSPTVDLYFFDGGYCGVQPVGENAVNACAMVRSDTAH